MTKLDDGTWHIEDADRQNPELDPESEEQISARFAYAGAHIALFLRWSLKHGLAPALEEYREEAMMVLDGTMSGTEFMEDLLDWKLHSEHVCEPVRAFAEAYYGSHRGLYDRDVGRSREGDYSWTEADCDFEAFSAMVNQRYNAFKERGPRAVKGSFLQMLGVKTPSPPEWRVST